MNISSIVTRVIPTYGHNEPDYRLVIDGQDITPKLSTRLTDLTLTDNRGFEADTLDITLDDSDGQLAFPRRGVSIALYLGWRGQPLVDKGTYVVDEIEHSGAPDKLMIRAKSADLRSGLKVKKEKSWRGKTLAAIVAAVAAEHGLTPRVSKSLAKVKIDHIDQTNESDVNLLTRLAQEHGAIATVKKGMLLFMPIGEAQSVTGTPFPTVTLTRASGDQHRFALSERDTYTSVTAYYQNTRSAAQGVVVVNAKGVKVSTRHKTGKNGKDPFATTADSTKVLRHTYANKTNATRAAKAEWERLMRGAATFSLTLALARPDLFPELPVIVTGFKPEIDGANWLIVRATHNLSNSGFTTSLDLELRPVST